MSLPPEAGCLCVFVLQLLWPYNPVYSGSKNTPQTSPELGILGRRTELDSTP